MKDGTPLRRDDSTVQKIASEAVKRVYQHTSSWVEKDATPRQLELLEQRKALAARFREQYGAADGDEPNVYPYFIGVFDCVASLSNRVALAGLIALAPILTALLSWIAWLVLRFFGIPVVWWHWFAGLTVAVVVVGFGLNLLSRIRVAFGLKDHPWYRTLHLAEPRMNFYDKTLSPKVGFARHAISIDEARSSFQRVGWGWAGVKKTSTPEWFEQFWFAGCHSDIGGGYEENGSRLSDISLQWMLDAACSVGLKYDPSVLRLHPDPSGPQHDEAKGGIFRFAGTTPRRIGPDFTLHPSVIERFKQTEVLNYDTMAPYRPENLREHDQLKQYY